MFPVLLLGGLGLMKPGLLLVATSAGSGCKLRTRALTAQRAEAHSGGRCPIFCLLQLKC